MIRTWFYPIFRGSFTEKQEVNLKIGIVAWDLNISGGTQRQALELAVHLQDMGHDIKVYTVYYNKERCYPDLLGKVNVKFLYSNNEEKRSKERRSLLKRIFVKAITFLKTEEVYERLTDLIDKDRDLICCHDYGVYPIGAKYKNKTGIPVVWQMNDLPIYKSSFKNLKDIIKFLLSPRFKLRHFNYIKKLDKIVAISNLNKNKLKENLGLESVVVRNGLDIENFNFNRRISPRNRLKIMFNGIFFPFNYIWGWASWRRAWKHYDVNMKL